MSDEVATVGVMLFKGPQARRCPQKAEHTKGGLWPPQESCYLRGHRQGGANTRRNTQKAICGHRRILVGVRIGLFAQNQQVCVCVCVCAGRGVQCFVILSD